MKYFIDEGPRLGGDSQTLTPPERADDAKIFAVTNELENAIQEAGLNRNDVLMFWHNDGNPLLQSYGSSEEYSQRLISELSSLANKSFQGCRKWIELKCKGADPRFVLDPAARVTVEEPITPEELDLLVRQYETQQGFSNSMDSSRLSLQVVSQIQSSLVDLGILPRGARLTSFKLRSIKPTFDIDEGCFYREIDIDDVAYAFQGYSVRASSLGSTTYIFKYPTTTNEAQRQRHPVKTLRNPLELDPMVVIQEIFAPSSEVIENSPNLMLLMDFGRMARQRFDMISGITLYDLQIIQALTSAVRQFGQPERD